MIKILIVEDEPHQISSLKRDISTLLQKNAALAALHWTFSEAENLSRAVELIKNKYTTPNLVFLDINLERKGDGFRLLEMFPKAEFETIFVTGHDKYAKRAIKFSGLDFLSKPVNMEELEGALERFLEKRQEREKLIKTLLENLQNKIPKVSFHTRDGAVVLHIHEIVCCEAENTKTHFHMENGDVHTASKILKTYEELLVEHGFSRVHQSFLVNWNFIERFDGNYLYLKNSREIFTCGIWTDKIPVSKRKKGGLDEFLGKL
ncbi:MAG: response regulator transcription factor [Saprospiraceae bacterium]|nr:response regulator transcription factor [Saprospiraceae bacterium]